MSDLRLRPAELSDAKFFWKVRNDPLSREMSFDEKYIPYAQHQHWFAKCIKSNDHEFFLAELDGKPAAFIRFDKVSADWIISIGIDPSVRGLGLCTPILLLAIEASSGRSQIQALIRHQNSRSLSCFEKAGFRLNRQESGVSHLSLHL